MTARIVLSCDGHRNGQPCRGALYTRALSPMEARFGEGAHWRSLHLNPDEPPLEARFIDLCPSAGHDEERA